MKKRPYQDIGFADSELKSFFCDFDSGVLDVKIELWNAIVISMQFSDMLFFSDHGSFFVTTLIEVKESKLLNEVLKYNYTDGQVPSNHPYKHFQFLDLYDDPRLEVICKSVEAYECDS